MAKTKLFDISALQIYALDLLLLRQIVSILAGIEGL